MNPYTSALKFFKANLLGHNASLALLLVIATLLFTTFSVFAHYPTGSKTPDTFLKAVMPELGHPVVELVYLALVPAASLLAVAMGHRTMVLIAFMVASLAGAVIRLMSIDLPTPEWVISAEASRLPMQFVGFIVCSIGGTVLSTRIVDSICPAIPSVRLKTTH